MEELMLKEHIEMLRQKYKISKCPKDIPLVCNECDLENMIFADLNEFGYIQIRLDFLNIPKPFHKASLVGYNSKTGPKWFLADPTYGQFFKNKKFSNYMYSRYRDFSGKLLEQGYIECTFDNMIGYIDGFANSNAFIQPLNSEFVFQTVYNFLLDNNILSNRNKKRSLKN